MSSIYKLTVGLEIHAELKTKTKMFCACKNDPEDDRPNVNVCPVCMAHPGTLPVINKQAVKNVLKVGLAIQGKLADFTEFDRKNYFYPDIPKGYQISQYKFPLVSGGTLKGVEITRVHLEEDTASSVHGEAGAKNPPTTLSRRLDIPPRAGGKENGELENDASLVDFNRAGVPLMELVTEPVIHSAEQAGNFARELQLVLQYLGVSDANMEKGEMRVEANISVAPENIDDLNPGTPFSKGGIESSSEFSLNKGSGESANRGILKSSAFQAPPLGKGELKSGSEFSLTKGSTCSDKEGFKIPQPPLGKGELSRLGTKCEVKNLNSFRAVEKAILYEYDRQVAVIEAGEKVVQETRGWDDSKQKTFSQRKKEDSHDYRYFPDPDLPKLQISEIPEFAEKELKKEMLELPEEKRGRYAKDYSIKEEDIEVFINSKLLSEMFDKFVAPKLQGDKNLIKIASNYITNDLKKLVEGRPEKIEIIKENFYELPIMIGAGEISSRGAKDILAEIVEKGGSPKVIAKEKNLIQKSDENELQKVVEEIIKNNQKVVQDFKGGKEASLQFLVGQGMKATKGSGNPEVIKKMLKEKIKNSL